MKLSTSAICLFLSTSVTNAFVVTTTKRSTVLQTSSSLYGANGDSSSTNIDVPSMAQTHMQGPLAVTGSGKALTKEELESVKAELEQIKKDGGLKEPVRSFMDDEDIKWRFGGKPDYSVTNLLYLKQRSTVHPDGSLEQIVENLVKTVSPVAALVVCVT
jgi:hypothetical protein